MMDIAEKFQKLGVVPVVVLEDTKDAVPLAFVWNVSHYSN